MTARFGKVFSASVAGFGFCLMGTAISYAQQVPGTVEPGRIEQRFQELPEPRATDQPLIPETQRDLAPEEAEKITFVLSGITLDGVTVYAESDLVPLYERHLGQRVSLRTIYEIADAIAAHYRNDGYILTRVVPPAQRVSNGIVRLKVMEGFIDKIEIEGAVDGDRARIARYADKIKESRPLTNRDLERYVLLINDLPGIRAKAILIPSFDTPGASDIVLQVARKRYDFSTAIDNRGTRFIGPGQVQIGAAINDVVLGSDRLEGEYIVTSQTEELKYLQAGYSTVVGSEGTVVSLSGNISTSEPGHTLEPFRIEGRNRTATVALRHPVIRARRQNFTTRISFTYKNSTTDVAEMLLSDDRLRVIRAGGAYDFVDGYNGINIVDAGVSQGVNIFNESTSGSANLTNASGRSDFTKVNLTAARLQGLPGPFSLQIAVTGQYAFSQLLVSEQFGFGGVPFGRAYDPSEYTGDHGAAGRVELRYAGPYRDDIVNSWDLYAYYDIGAVWRIDSRFLEARASAASVGGGVRFRVFDNLSGYLEVSDPLTGSVIARGEDGDEPRFFFSLRADL